MGARVLRLHPQAVVLRAVATQPVAIADVTYSVDRGRTIVRPCCRFVSGVGDADLASLGQLRALETSAADTERIPALALIGYETYNELVFGKARMQRDPLESVVALAGAARCRPNGLRIQDAVADDPQPPGSF